VSKNILHDALERVIATEWIRGTLKESDIDRVATKAIETALPRITAELTDALKRNAPQMLREQRKLYAGFVRRNHKRWGAALDLLETLWVIASEAGDNFNDQHRPEAVENSDYQFEALTQIHARALLVVGEIICLLDGGYPDGALSRWRTLHELAVVSLFLCQEATLISYRYLASFHFRAFRAAKQINECADKAGLDAISDEELSSMKRRCNTLASELGDAIWNDYGWAAPAIGKSKPNFADLEMATNLDHWRPRYRWASQHVHGGPRPKTSFLGVTEAVEEIFLVGPSNSGFVDPIHMTAISLAQVTCALLGTKAELDEIVIMSVLSNISVEIGPLAMELETQTRQLASSAGYPK
jgi:hypothetical protein